MRHLAPALEELLRRADPTAHIYTELVAVDRTHLRRIKDDWADADGGLPISNMTPRDDGGLQLAEAQSTKIFHAAQDGFATNLDNTTPFDMAYIEWAGSDPANITLNAIKPYLHPFVDGNSGNQDVATWVLQVYALIKYDPNGLGSEEELTLLPLHAPIEQEAGTSAGVVTFDLTGIRIKPKAHIPFNADGGFTWKYPTTFIQIRGIQSDGTDATNIGWGKDSAVSDTKTTSGNILGSRQLSKPVGNEEQGTYADEAAANNRPYVTVSTGTFTTATVTFGNNPFDLGAAPSNAVEFVCRADVPVGTSMTYQVENDSAVYVNILDGQTVADIADLAKVQTYKMRATLTTNATSDVTPILREFGVREVTINDITDVASPRGATWGFNPVTLTAEIGQVNIVAIRDGILDFEDRVTEILAAHDIGSLFIRLWIGATNASKYDEWLHIDDYFIDDTEGLT
ncbi:hypothetical protein LCGC14_1930810, partial [marine sediment metagenome]